MSLSTLLGVLAGFALFFAAIATLTNNYMAFVDGHGAMIVFGGTIASAYMSYEARYVNAAFKAIVDMLKKPKAARQEFNAEIMRLVKWAYVVQQKGLPALEAEVKSTKVSDPLIQYCITLVATAYKPEDIHKMCETAIESEFERNTTPVAILKNMAGTAPAFGMIGTLVGMVIMMNNMGDDMSKLGEGLAVALLATLYAVSSARLVFMPAADKLQQREEILRLRNYLVMEGLVMLADKQSPRFMQDKLNSFLEPKDHFDIDTQMSK